MGGSAIAGWQPAAGAASRGRRGVTAAVVSATAGLLISTVPRNASAFAVGTAGAGASACGRLVGGPVRGGPGAGDRGLSETDSATAASDVLLGILAGDRRLGRLGLRLEQARMGEIDRDHIVARHDHAHPEPGDLPKPRGKIMGHPDAAVRGRVARQRPFMQRDARTR